MYTGSCAPALGTVPGRHLGDLLVGLVTFILMKVIGLVLRGARYKDEVLEVGDLAIHDEEAFPEETLAHRAVGSPSPGSAPRLTTGYTWCYPQRVRRNRWLTRTLNPRRTHHEAHCCGAQAVQTR